MFACYSSPVMKWNREIRQLVVGAFIFPLFATNVAAFTYIKTPNCTKKGEAYYSGVNGCVQVPSGASVQCLGSHEFWNGQSCVSSVAILKNKTATPKERQAAVKAQKEEIVSVNKKCTKDWGSEQKNLCVSLSKKIEKNPHLPLYVYIPCAVFFSQQHSHPNYHCRPGDTFKLSRTTHLPSGLNAHVQFVFYGPAGEHPNQATNDYLCQKKTLKKTTAENLAKSCLPLGEQVTFSAGVDSENVHGKKKIHLTIYPGAGSIGYSNGSPSTVKIGNQYLGIPTGKNAFDVVVAQTPSWTPPKKNPKTPGSKKGTGSGTVAKKPKTTPAPASPGKGNSCKDLEARLVTAKNQVQLCLGALQKSPAMQALIKNCEKYQKKSAVECAANLPLNAPPPVLVSKKDAEKPDLAQSFFSCSRKVQGWQAVEAGLQQQIAKNPDCPKPKTPSTGNNPPSCPNGQVWNSSLGGCATNGNGQASPPTPNSNCTQSASAPTASPDGQKGKNSTAKKADSGNKTASVDCGGQDQGKKSSWPKLPWKGMGLIGAYGGLLGALLLGPIGMFIFGLVGVGVGYLISK